MNRIDVMKRWSKFRSFIEKQLERLAFGVDKCFVFNADKSIHYCQINWVV